MKKILGLDLGTTSIGWAYVHEAENKNEVSSIQKLGVRVNPLTVDEQINFEKGKPITTNAGRTLARAARRNLQRFKLRRENLIDVLKKNNFIDDATLLAEDGNRSTFETYAFRSKAAKEQISLTEFARVLLMINKKRGYKSSRKVNNDEEGSTIDGMEVAKLLYENDLTPGAYVLNLLLNGKKTIPDFYRSDLQNELDLIWEFQKQFYPDLFTEEFKKELTGKGQKATATIFWARHGFNTAENKGKRDEKKRQAYQWRVEALSKQLTKEEVAFVIADINNNLYNSSGYLGAISDRSKELYFNQLTVGEYLYQQLESNPHARLKSQVFYRKDYMDEFEIIWETQKQFHAELTDELKKEIRDIVIFYQRKLKSQKGLISICEYENKLVDIQVKGKQVQKLVGLRVAPKSSPLFQEFKIWQILHHLEFKNKTTKALFIPDLEEKTKMFEELNLKGNLKIERLLETIGCKPKEWESNYAEVEGNRTNQVLFDAYLEMLQQAGYDEELFKLSGKDDISVNALKTPANELHDMVRRIFDVLEINTQCLCFDAQLDGEDFENQPAYQLWHLLYAYEVDESASGNEKLYELLHKKFGFSLEQSKLLGKVSFALDYGSLSTKAMRKIYPFLAAGHPLSGSYKDKAIVSALTLAGYRHSKNSLTKDELSQRELADVLTILTKNSLRNPVVEKILNQMINVVNTLIESESKKDAQGNITEYFKFDEIRVELARELKKNAKERADSTSRMSQAKGDHLKITSILQKEFGILNPTRNDIIRYKLYEELSCNGYKDLYTNTYIAKGNLFSKEYDVDHIIPQARVFDDSFSNKTIVPKQVNLDKGSKTAIDYIEGKFGDAGVVAFQDRIDTMLKALGNEKFRAKSLKLVKHESEIGDGFIERDLRDSQYIAKKAKEMLFGIAPAVVSTSGSVTNRLREDWDLVNVMKELNIDKYRMLGLTEELEMKEGKKKEVIIDWTKRNDHRHHAMDALTVAFTQHNHIQYLNYLNARKDENHKEHASILAIEKKITFLEERPNGRKKVKFCLPIPHFRQEAKKHLESVLISQKAKNKVVTMNVNKIPTKKGDKPQATLTPRGQLHKETVYGKIDQYVTKEEKIGGGFNRETIDKVANLKYKARLLERLEEFDNDPKKAFTGKNSLDKNPVFLDEEKTQTLPLKVKLVWLETDFTIRKEVNPDNFKDYKNLEKVIDVGIRNRLIARLKEFEGNAKEAFANLELNPIYLNEEKGIPIKRVKISGVNNTEALHHKKDHFGEPILDEKGNEISTDFVSTGNNHHIAIYIDQNGKYQENVVSFYKAVARVNAQLPIIDKHFNQHLGWVFQFTMKQNEMFVFPSDDFDPSEIDLFDPKNYRLISPNLFRVQKIATKDFVFRHHLETTVEDNVNAKGTTWKRLGLSGLEKSIKVRINHIGQIISVGEY